MGRMYTLMGNTMTVGTGYVLACLKPAAAGNAGSLIAIHRVEVSQGSSTTSAMVYLALSNRSTAGTLTVTSATPANMVAGGPASGITGNTSGIAVPSCGVNSSNDTGGTYTDYWNAAANALNGWLWVPTPPELIIVPPAGIFCVRFISGPATTTGWKVTEDFEELY